jgi:hypothetical protein
VLEHRQEFAGRQQRLLLLAHPYEHLGKRVALGAGERADRLVVERQLIVVERGVQARSRIAPAGELLIHLIEEFFVHPRHSRGYRHKENPGRVEKTPGPNSPNPRSNKTSGGLDSRSWVNLIYAD